LQKFIDGLRYNISNVISLHKPRTVGATLSLAIIQEEILEASSKRFPLRVRESSRSTDGVNRWAQYVHVGGAEIIHKMYFGSLGQLVTFFA
jgi:hypothetical protein